MEAISNSYVDYVGSKQFWKYFKLYTALAFLMLICAITTHNGLIVACIFVVTSFIVIASCKTIKSLAPYYIVLMINNALIEMDINVLGGITLTAVILIYFIVVFFITLLKNYKQSKLISNGLFVAWGVYLIFNTIYNKVSGISSTLFSLLTPMIIAVLMQWISIKKRKSYSYMIVAAMVSALVIVLLCGYIELIYGKSFFYSLWAGENRYRYGILRVGSTASDPNFLCLTEIFLLCIVNVPIIRKYMGKKLWIILSVLTIIQVVLTFSRTGIIALASVCVLMLSKKHRKLFVISTPIIAISLVSLVNVMLGSLDTLDANSYFSRMRIITLVIEMWKSKPVLGYGNNGFYNVSKQLLGNQRSTMNEYVRELINYGIVGLVFYTGFLLYTTKKCIGGFSNRISVWKDSNAIYYFSAIISWCIMSASLDTYSKILIWILPAIVLAIKNISEDYQYGGQK